MSSIHRIPSAKHVRRSAITVLALAIGVGAVPVSIAQDDGVHAEIASGLSPDDQVVVKYNGAISDGLPVEIEPAQSGGSEKPSH